MIRRILLPGLVLSGLVMLSLAAMPAAGQPETALGERVRLTYTPWPQARAATVVGRLARASDDSLAVVREDRSVAVPLASVDRLEISRGRRSQIWTGALAGGVGGGLLMGAIATASYEPCTGWCIMHLSRSELFLTGALVGGLGGALLGGIIGSAVKVDAWEPLPVHATVGIRGAAIRVSF